MRKITKLLALLFFAPLAFAQGPPPNLSKTAGVYVVSPYSQWTDQIAVGNATTGAGSTIVLTSGSVLLPDNRRIVPFATTVPLLVDVGTSAETVTPTAVSGCSASSSGPCTITANFTKLHQVYATVFSGTSGVQDAINDASSQTAAIVVMDLSSQPNPTTPTPSNIAIFDYRTAGAPLYWAGGSSSGAAWGSSGGGATPCITTALSLQFNSAGSLGCEPDLTFTAPHTLALAASGIFNVAGTLGLANASGFTVPSASGFASSSSLQYGIDTFLGNVHLWTGLDSIAMTVPASATINSGDVAGFLVSTSTKLSDLGAPGGGGTSFLRCTVNGLNSGDYFGVNNSNICAEIVPGMAPVAITASGTTVLASSYRGEFVKFASTSGSQTAALPDPTTTGFQNNFYFRLANHGTVGALSLTNNGGAATFNGSASPYSIPEGNSCDITTNTAGTGWSVVCTPGTLTAGTNTTLTQTQYGVTINGLTTPISAANGGTGVANTATLTLGTANVNYASQATGFDYVTTTTGAHAAATATQLSTLVQNLTGCSTSGFVYAPAQNDCVAQSGGGGLSGMTATQIPIAASATTVTSSIPLLGTDTNIPTAASITPSQPYVCSDANGGVTTTGCGVSVNYYNGQGSVGTANNFIGTAGTTFGYGFVATDFGTFGHFLVDLATVDNTSDTYNFGIYSLSGSSGTVTGALVCSTGAIAGSTLGGSTGFKVLTPTGSCTLTKGALYIFAAVAITANTAKFVGSSAGTIITPFSYASVAASSAMPSTLSGVVISNVSATGAGSLWFEMYP